MRLSVREVFIVNNFALNKGIFNLIYLNTVSERLDCFLNDR